MVLGEEPYNLVEAADYLTSLANGTFSRADLLEIGRPFVDTHSCCLQPFCSVWPLFFPVAFQPHCRATIAPGPAVGQGVSGQVRTQPVRLDPVPQSNTV